LKKITEFSKLVVMALTITWFLTAFFAMYIISRGYGSLDSLLTYVGAPMSAGLLGYLCKAAFENKEKIKKGPPSSDDSGL